MDVQQDQPHSSMTLLEQAAPTASVLMHAPHLLVPSGMDDDDDVCFQPFGVYIYSNNSPQSIIVLAATAAEHFDIDEWSYANFDDQTVAMQTARAVLGLNSQQQMCSQAEAFVSNKQVVGAILGAPTLARAAALFQYFVPSLAIVAYSPVAELPTALYHVVTESSTIHAASFSPEKLYCLLSASDELC
eukprot:m.352244 g.352244  ORF g.352244 m.352244 type:complete len:188 (-) comp16474_c0_seq1:233-796(-)